MCAFYIGTGSKPWSISAPSRTGRFPHFDIDCLRQRLDAAGIEYHWAGRHFGGMRTARTDSPHVGLAVNLRGYADHMATDEFSRAVSSLVRLAATRPLAVMCAERLPDHCHRSLLSDFLTIRLGLDVVHIIDHDSSMPCQPRPKLRRQERRLVYDRNAQSVLPF